MNFAPFVVCKSIYVWIQLFKPKLWLW